MRKGICEDGSFAMKTMGGTTHRHPIETIFKDAALEPFQFGTRCVDFAEAPGFFGNLVKGVEVVEDMTGIFSER